MSSKSIFRNAVYINQVPELTERERRYQKRKRDIHCSMKRKSQKLICTDRKTGQKTTCIVFPNGKVYVGDDVWRLSNRADCCEYPFRGYSSLQIAAVDYDIREAEATFPEYSSKPEEGRYAVCV